MQQTNHWRTRARGHASTRALDTLFHHASTFQMAGPLFLASLRDVERVDMSDLDELSQRHVFCRVVFENLG